MGDAAMRKLNLAVPVLLLAGSWFLAPEALAQNPPSSPSVQRAPGVPSSPNTTEIARRKALREGAVRTGDRGLGEPGQTAPRDPDRDLPMPRGVPSIIAP